MDKNRVKLASAISGSPMKSGPDMEQEVETDDNETEGNTDLNGIMSMLKEMNSKLDMVCGSMKNK